MFYCGLDISLRKTSICIVDRDGAIVKEATVASDPGAIGQALRDSGRPLERIGLEAGSTSSWLPAGLRAQGWPVVCIGARHAAAALRAGFRNRTDRNDARGIADLMRVSKFRQVRVKPPEARRQGAPLTARSAPHRQLVNLESIIRGILRGEGVVLPLGRARFEREVQQGTAADGGLAGIVAPPLAARAGLLRQRAAVDRRIVETARHDPVCRLPATAPGVGAHVALAFRAAIDDPARLRRPRTVGAHLGLTPRQHGSGEVNRTCGIGKMGDRHARAMLHVAAPCILRRDVGLWCGPKARAPAVAKARGIRKARVAPARRLAVVLHRMWVTGEPFRWTRRAGAAARPRRASGEARLTRSAAADPGPARDGGGTSAPVCAVRPATGTPRPRLRRPAPPRPRPAPAAGRAEREEKTVTSGTWCAASGRDGGRSAM